MDEPARVCQRQVQRAREVHGRQVDRREHARDALVGKEVQLTGTLRGSAPGAVSHAKGHEDFRRAVAPCRPRDAIDDRHRGVLHGERLLGAVGGHAAYGSSGQQRPNCEHSQCHGRLAVGSVRFGVPPVEANRMQVRVLAFARLREMLETSEARVELPQGARIADVWEALERRFPALRGQSSWIRIACNGRLVDPNQSLLDGDEVALLPPVGGG